MDMFHFFSEGILKAVYTEIKKMGKLLYYVLIQRIYVIMNFMKTLN